MTGSQKAALLLMSVGEKCIQALRHDA